MTTIQSRKLLLIPSEVNKLVSDLKSALDSYGDELFGTMTPISSYMQDNHLTGQAYTNSKNHMEDHISVIAGMISANKEFEARLDMLSSIVGTERLDEAQLEATVDSCIRNINMYKQRIRAYENNVQDAMYNQLWGNFASWEISRCNRIINNFESTKKLAEEKIQKLHEISAKSMSYFDSITEIYANVTKGIDSLNASRMPTSFKPRVDEAWRTELNAELEGKHLGKNVDSIISQLKKKYPELGEDVLSKIREELLITFISDKFARDLEHDLGSEFLENGLTSAGVGISKMSSIIGNALIKVGSTPGPVGENSFVMLGRTGRIGSKILSKGIEIEKGVGVAGKAVKGLGYVGKAMPIIGTAADIGVQIYNGESVPNAVIKGTAHLGVSVGAAKVGAILGTAIAPGVGTVVGAVAGVAVGVLIGTIANTGVDYFYDKFIGERVDKAVEKVKDVGRAVASTLGGIGNAIFG